MILRGQDKGLGPKDPKPLSAHLFLRPTKYTWWATDSVILPIGLENLAGPKREMPQKRPFWGFYL